MGLQEKSYLNPGDRRLAAKSGYPELARLASRICEVRFLEVLFLTVRFRGRTDPPVGRVFGKSPSDASADALVEANSGIFQTI